MSAGQLFARCALVSLVVAPAVHAQTQDLGEGFLCCNMRANGTWISDSNYEETKGAVVRVGTPLKHDGFGRYRVHVLIDGKRSSIGNDYSRDLTLDEFAKRYIVKDDPRTQIAAAKPAIRTAIESFKVASGMTKEQVLMAVGYPMYSENPSLDAKEWKYWLSSFAPFTVYFGADNRVNKVEGDAATLAKVYAR
jgi:hypothetical protein